MLPNPGFEDGVNNHPVQSAAGTVDQPMLPTGWAFEGAAGLFDHTAAERHSGRYSAGISIPAGGKRKACAQEPVGCHDNTPLNTAKSAALTAYSVNPAWRPALPLAVRAGTAYVVSGWMSWQLASITDGGAIVSVRWLDANGVPLRTDNAVTRIADREGLNWTFFSAVVVAPAGAAQAVPLFGAADDVFITKVSYDDVSFHAA
ncbi:MAG: hypothetical protein QOK43_1771 [Acidimicrobiaceae bacterium]|nr:hypothetical protein [Acidimicrobiaceae bacterium]